MSEKVLIIIPAYNEKESLRELIPEIRRKCRDYDYLIINDCSTDATASFCEQQGYHVLNLPVNVGLSGAIRAGMRYAYLNKYDYAVQVDGDGQHDPFYVRAMIEYQKRNHVDIVIGSRFKTKKKPFTMRMIGSRIISFSIWLTTGGKHIGDVTSGMRLFNKGMIERFAYRLHYTPEPDTLAFLLNHGVKIGEIQVEMYDRVAGKSYLTAPATVRYMMTVLFHIFMYQWVRKE